MPKDILDEILEVTDKNSIMLKKLLKHGLSRDELKKALFDQSGMARVKAEVYKSHYEPERNELNKAIRNLSAVINNPALDWLNGYWQKDQLKALKESFTAKRDELYPNPKGGLTWNQMVGRKVGNLFNIIETIVVDINNAGQKHYSQVDTYKLIACLWAYTYGQLEGNFTHEQIKKLYDNNKSKIPLK